MGSPLPSARTTPKAPAASGAGAGQDARNGRTVSAICRCIRSRRAPADSTARMWPNVSSTRRYPRTQRPNLGPTRASERPGHARAAAMRCRQGWTRSVALCGAHTRHAPPQHGHRSTGTPVDAAPPDDGPRVRLASRQRPPRRRVPPGHTTAPGTDGHATQPTATSRFRPHARRYPAGRLVPQSP
jgi:hypothetical protein